MNAQTVFWHLLNFSAPALALALLLPGVARFLNKKPGLSLSWPAQSAINFVAGLAACGLALAFNGYDGKISGYTALVLVSATSQWLLARGWRG